MIDPQLSLAVSVHSNPGVYALLLGSGVSRSAGIPTGWEIVLDLIRKLAAMKGEEPGPDPVTWYRNSFGVDPDYARLLDAVAKSPPERQQLLRAYFEPTEEEREEGLKVPTAAHRAIAELVAKGYFRVILTTNFDRLTERALEDVGIAPTVIDTPDKVSGAMPIVHTKCTVVKLHGDYLDTRIRNTPDELENYEAEVNRLLDRVMDEFGLIVCGWSAEWDTALRAALERCPTRRFTTYWAARGDPSPRALAAVQHRRAQKIEVADADHFFVSLGEKVASLEDLRHPHPLSAKLGAATVKRLLVDPAHRIRLHDLVVEEANQVVVAMGPRHFPSEVYNDGVFLDQVVRYEALTETLRLMLAAGCYWGEPIHDRLWTTTLERIARAAERTAGHNHLVKLRRYPAMLCMYAAGIGAVGGENYGALRALLARATTRNYDGEQAVMRVTYNHEVMEREIAQKLPEQDKKYTPVNNHLHDLLGTELCGLIPDPIRYTETFDRFEYLLSMIYADHAVESAYGWVPVGAFLWRDRDRSTGTATRIRREIEQAGGDWAPLGAGLFGGSSERALTAWRTTEEHTQKVRMQLHVF